MAAEERVANQVDGISVCVLGGCGMIGRNFVKWLLERRKLNVERIKVLDSKLPALAFFTPALRELFKDSRVAFQQSDLTREAHVTRALNEEKFDYIFNCCGETRCGKDAQEYQRRNVESARLFSAAVVQMPHPPKWVEISEARIYKDNSSKKKENGKIAPWTKVAHSRLEAENVIKNVDGLQYVILRPALVYGPGDKESLTPRILCAATYKHNNETMKFLWGKSLKINTVHVRDVCKAMWLAATQAESGSVYNLADETDLDQGKFNKILGSIFQIKTGFFNRAFNLAAKLAVSTVASTSNSKHVPAWSELCQAHSILNTPLSPYMDVEIIKNCHLSVDGTKITQDLGFSYDHPQVSQELIEEVINEYVTQGLFPPVLENN